MAWQMSGQAIELCNCKLLCPCWLGPAQPDQGYCASGWVFDIREGNADGVRLDGRKVAFAAEWPGDFWSGNGTARLYIDAQANADQRRELEGIFSGKRGGFFEGVMGGIISKWLPTQVTRIEVRDGATPAATVGDVAQIRMQPLKDPQGRATTVQGAAAQAAFQIERMNVASSKGSRWADPELRSWEGDSGNLVSFSWRS